MVEVWIEKRFHTTSSISSGKVASLDHEVLNDTVEFAAHVTESFLLGHKGTHCNSFMHLFSIFCNYQWCRVEFGPIGKDESKHLSCSQGEEILSGLRDGFSKQSNDNAPYVLISNPDIKVYLRQDRRIMSKIMDTCKNASEQLKGVYKTKFG